MPLHYAPRTPAFWIEPDQLLDFRPPGRNGFLIVGPYKYFVRPNGPWIELENVAEASRRLYASSTNSTRRTSTPSGSSPRPTSPSGKPSATASGEPLVEECREVRQRPGSA